MKYHKAVIHISKNFILLIQLSSIPARLFLLIKEAIGFIIKSNIPSKEEHLRRLEALHSKMKKNSIYSQAFGVPVTSAAYADDKSHEEPVSPYLQPSSYVSIPVKKNTDKKGSFFRWMGKLRIKVDLDVQAIREHVSLGHKISETVKGKCSLSSRIIQAGGVDRVFRQVFYVNKGEKLLKASQCYLSTTAGPISGMLFVSTNKIAFQSDVSLSLISSRGECVRVPYKVLISLESIKRAISSENIEKPSQKYIQIVTVDDFEFWFMGFLCYQKSFKYLMQAITKSPGRME